MAKLITRRALVGGLAAGAGSLLAGCDKLSDSESFRKILFKAEGANKGLQRLLTDRTALAREFSPEQLSPVFRANGSVRPASADYQAHLASNFANWRLAVDGAVRRPLSLSMAQIRSMPHRTQITRHDCVEGWSAIGQWTGVPLKLLLDQAGLRSDAKFLVFHCADAIGGHPYYESIDLVDAFHPQTILAWGMNGHALPVPNGAPLRLRVERQLGYKQAKYVMRVEAVPSLAPVGLGKGGFWEDYANYEWYAGI
jgi:DMSO/TMAO reductase YedYZ molybdopterin-dependent catalytic subunit